MPMEIANAINAVKTNRLYQIAAKQAKAVSEQPVYRTFQNKQGQTVKQIISANGGLSVRLFDGEKLLSSIEKFLGRHKSIITFTDHVGKKSKQISTAFVETDNGLVIYRKVAPIKEEGLIDSKNAVYHRYNTNPKEHEKKHEIQRVSPGQEFNNKNTPGIYEEFKIQFKS